MAKRYKPKVIKGSASADKLPSVEKKFRTPGAGVLLSGSSGESERVSKSKNKSVLTDRPLSRWRRGRDLDWSKRSKVDPKLNDAMDQMAGQSKESRNGRLNDLYSAVKRMTGGEEQARVTSEIPDQTPTELRNDDSQESVNRNKVDEGVEENVRRELQQLESDIEAGILSLNKDTDTISPSPAETVKTIRGQQMVERGKSALKEGAILICVDLEFYEINTKKITEVGMAIYDPPGSADDDNGCRLSTHFKVVHFIVWEDRWLRNGRFVADNKFDFLFGKSAAMSMNDCRLAFEQIVKHYESKAAMFDRNLLFVGHGFKSDLQMLQKNNFYLGSATTNHLDFLDSCDMWAASNCKFGSLNKVLLYLEIETSKLHNAGNDAYFTLVLCLCLSQTSFRQKWELDNTDREHLLTPEQELETSKKEQRKRLRKAFQNRAREQRPELRRIHLEDVITMFEGDDYSVPIPAYCQL
jgi:hypothetical protein